MYSRHSKGINRGCSVQWVLFVFMLITVLYLPLDDLSPRRVDREPTVKSRNENSASSLSIAEDAIQPVLQEVTIAQEPEADSSRVEEVLEESQDLIASSPEATINSYISEIVTAYYPELDETTIQAIVYNESHYTPDAINSSSGTMGLMQISPKWHTERAANLGVTDLLDAYGNILVGCDILAEVTRQNGSFTYALDVFAGGYSYANSYVDSISPTRAHILETVNMINDGTITF